MPETLSIGEEQSYRELLREIRKKVTKETYGIASRRRKKGANNGRN